MKKLLIATILSAGIIGSGAAVAGESSSCHFHGKKVAPEETVSSCAFERKELLIMGGKIDPSWERVEQDKIELVDGKKGKEWLVTFTNPAVADKSKAKLYMFFTAPGNFIAANFSGK
ncbi:hypothetical protein SAMN05216428_11549 [Nitrosospira sp. Nsp11]|uniref:DUF6488 family protein n=1 Tax=Nitrosospira sp. Nsp11 TaxID=1855338 RepID=UPI00091F82C6|nr:DUF6488 family protein [Nitrosospira sp. Nsp11]SHM14839.1 hypothetical protein SAMN05216428_11549 [Nitrosospira sp. Nsp11]